MYYGREGRGRYRVVGGVGPESVPWKRVEFGKIEESRKDMLRLRYGMRERDGAYVRHVCGNPLVWCRRSAKTGV